MGLEEYVHGSVESIEKGKRDSITLRVIETGSLTGISDDSGNFTHYKPGELMRGLYETANGLGYFAEVGAETSIPTVELSEVVERSDFGALEDTSDVIDIERLTDEKEQLEQQNSKLKQQYQNPTTQKEFKKNQGEIQRIEEDLERLRREEGSPSYEDMEDEGLEKKATIETLRRHIYLPVQVKQFGFPDWWAKVYDSLRKGKRGEGMSFANPKGLIPQEYAEARYALEKMNSTWAEGFELSESEEALKKLVQVYEYEVEEANETKNAKTIKDTTNKLKGAQVNLATVTKRLDNLEDNYRKLRGDWAGKKPGEEADDTTLIDRPGLAATPPAGEKGTGKKFHQSPPRAIREAGYGKDGLVEELSQLSTNYKQTTDLINSVEREKLLSAQEADVINLLLAYRGKMIIKRRKGKAPRVGGMLLEDQYIGLSPKKPKISPQKALDRLRELKIEQFKNNVYVPSKKRILQLIQRPGAASGMSEQEIENLGPLLLGQTQWQERFKGLTSLLGTHEPAELSLSNWVAYLKKAGVITPLLNQFKDNWQKGLNAGKKKKLKDDELLSMALERAKSELPRSVFEELEKRKEGASLPRPFYSLIPEEIDYIAKKEVKDLAWSSPEEVTEKSLVMSEAEVKENAKQLADEYVSAISEQAKKPGGFFKLILWLRSLQANRKLALKSRRDQLKRFMTDHDQYLDLDLDKITKRFSSVIDDVKAFDTQLTNSSRAAKAKLRENYPDNIKRVAKEVEELTSLTSSVLEKGDDAAPFVNMRDLQLINTSLAKASKAFESKYLEAAMDSIFKAYAMYYSLGRYYPIVSDRTYMTAMNSIFEKYTVQSDVEEAPGRVETIERGIAIEKPKAELRKYLEQEEKLKERLNEVRKKDDELIAPILALEEELGTHLSKISEDEEITHEIANQIEEISERLISLKEGRVESRKLLAKGFTFEHPAVQAKAKKDLESLDEEIDNLTVQRTSLVSKIPKKYEQTKNFLAHLDNEELAYRKKAVPLDEEVEKINEELDKVHDEVYKLRSRLGFND